MKVIFDTNVYISFIRNRTHENVLQQRGTVKYLSAIVLMELWAGARTKRAKRLISHLQKPYMDASRIITLQTDHYITIGNIYSDIPTEYMELRKKADFMNDIQIAMTALSIGAVLYTENVTHFSIIKSIIGQLKVSYLTP
jgi:predicted nucleic acid-binding protein